MEQVLGLFDGFFGYLVVGIFAQLVDGALGMAYGVIASTLLLSMGVTPAAASGTVNLCKIATGIASGAAHWWAGNVDRRLCLQLALAGAVGAVLGAVLLAWIDSNALRPFIAGYLVIMGLLILRRAIVGRRIASHHLPTLPLGLLGGFCNSIGGGGWGPVVTSSLLTKDIEPRIAIGTTNVAEVVVAAAAVVVLAAGIGRLELDAVLGLMLGGVIAAPVAALGSRHVPARALMLVVGVLVIGLGGYTISKTFT